MTLLTPAIISDLRTSISYRGSSDSTNPIGVAFIVYIPSDDAFSLHAYGAVWAEHKDAAILGECLRQERAEPGFIRRILGTLTDVREASLDPAGRAHLASQRRAHAIAAAAYEDDQRAAIASRAAHLNLSALSLDDL